MGGGGFPQGTSDCVWRQAWLSKLVGAPRVEVKEAVKHPTMHRTAPMANDDLAPNANGTRLGSCFKCPPASTISCSPVDLLPHHPLKHRPPRPLTAPSQPQSGLALLGLYREGIALHGLSLLPETLSSLVFFTWFRKPMSSHNHLCILFPPISPAPGKPLHPCPSITFSVPAHLVSPSAPGWPMMSCELPSDLPFMPQPERSPPSQTRGQRPPLLVLQCLPSSPAGLLMRVAWSLQSGGSQPLRDLFFHFSCSRHVPPQLPIPARLSLSQRGLLTTLTCPKDGGQIQN